MLTQLAAACYTPRKAERFANFKAANPIRCVTRLGRQGIGSGIGAEIPVWHFEDDAVTGEIRVLPGMSPIMPEVDQLGFLEQNYLPPWDGPTPIIQFSKDLAFELYTRVIPEPASAAMLALGGLALVGLVRRR